MKGVITAITLSRPTIKSPVCGIEINPKDAFATEEYQGKAYYFCSAACHEKFNAALQKYMS